MANGDDLHLPLEIPWWLASTTQLLTAGEPDETTISLFTFQPDDAVLTSQFPDQSLVFLKVTVSISPAAFPSRAAFPSGAAVVASALGEGIPCYHMLLDMKVRKGTGDLGTDRPYFHAAAPMRRQMLQTGVIGTDVFEGESDGQFMGKSGSQMYETASSHSTTSSGSAGFNLAGVGVSGRTSTTDVTSSRDVTQVSDTTTREASQERRELVSHMTKVENVLTLLNAKYVGTPYLRFSLSPQPLQQLSVDTSDPSLWFGQLLQRRSGGIEGVQEFTTVVVVPKGEDFCVAARLRRVCLLDDPPGPPNFDEPFPSFNGPGAETALARLLNYLLDTYPAGTPLDDLAVDITDALASEPEKYKRPVIEVWPVDRSARLIIAGIVSPGAVLGEVHEANVNYTHILELWLETLRDEYERDLARSPLERGVLMGENRRLDTCFTFDADGVLTLLNSTSSVSPLAPLPIPAGDLDVGGLQSTAISARTSRKARALETVTRWNALEKQLATLLGNLSKKFPDQPGKLNDSRIVRVLVDRWAKFRPEDPRNLDFETAMDALKLNEKHRRLLKAAGVTDLKSLARALKAAPILERYNGDIRRKRTERKAARAAAPPGDLIEFPISNKAAEEIRKAIGDSLFGEAEPPPSED